jgi:hypothetical protein
MAGKVLINDQSAVFEATHALYTAAQAMYNRPNGTSLSFDQEATNFRAKRLVDFANELRRRVKLDPQNPLDEQHDALAGSWSS